MRAPRDGAGSLANGSLLSNDVNRNDVNNSVVDDGNVSSDLESSDPPVRMKTIADMKAGLLSRNPRMQKRWTNKSKKIDSGTLKRNINALMAFQDGV